MNSLNNQMIIRRAENDTHAQNPDAVNYVAEVSYLNAAHRDVPWQ